MESKMNWDQIEGNWKQFKGKVKEQWGKLTDDHIDMIAGKRDQLSGKIQESYGISKEEADKQISDWERKQTGIPVGFALKRAAFPLYGCC